MLLLLGHL
jgi:hypothetical protein